MTRYDANVNFNWGNDYLIDDIAQNYVSITWQGFIRVPSPASYTFTLRANDGVRLTLNQQIVFDQLTTVGDEVIGHRLITDPIALNSNDFIPIKLEYFENTDNAFVTLMWRTTNSYTDDKVIPAENFYYKRYHTPISG